MKKILFVMLVFLLLNLSLVSAITQQEVSEAKSLIDSKADCKGLSDSQLEIMGEYYMEQMHPGESHKLMHKMMKLKEGSEDEEQFHISMAKAIYCGETNAFGSGMMGGGMMNMMMGSNMMGYGMMGSNPFGYGYGYWSFWNIIWTLFWIGVIVLIIWLIYKFIIKREGLHETPIVTLKKRYASGEITKKQFEQMKKEIEE